MKCLHSCSFKNETLPRTMSRQSEHIDVILMYVRIFMLSFEVCSSPADAFKRIKDFCNRYSSISVGILCICGE